MADAFRDFIPEGEDTGGVGHGFRDFVPPREQIKPLRPRDEKGRLLPMKPKEEGK